MGWQSLVWHCEMHRLIPKALLGEQEYHSAILHDTEECEPEGLKSAVLL